MKEKEKMMSKPFMYEPILDYSEPYHRDQSIVGLNLNSREEVQTLINEVLPSVLEWEENSNIAGMILEGMLEEQLKKRINRDEVKKFLTDHFERRASTHKIFFRGFKKALEGK